MEELFKLDNLQNLAPAKGIVAYSKQMEEVMKLGANAETQYPNSPDLHSVRLYMLRAEHFFLNSTQDDVHNKRLVAIAEKILSSDAPVGHKFQADLVRTSTRIAQGSKLAENETGKIIGEFVKRYKNTDLAPVSTMYAHGFAVRSILPKLAQQLRELLESKYRQDPQITKYLNYIANSFFGTTFSATLTRLDGTTLKLPEDLKDKVVVIDFWATWCAPCIAYIPEMKRIHAKYKDKGVEIVGISLDSKRSALEKYVRKEKLTWIHTFAGKGWQDPTAVKYGVRGIPSIWVIGPDGKVISDQARGQLEYVIDRALQELHARKGK